MERYRTCKGVSHVLFCRFGVTSSNYCRPFVSIGRHFTDPDEASSARLWQPFLGAWQAEQSTNTASFSYTSHFYLFELIYYVVKAILFVESQRAIWELKHFQYEHIERWYCTIFGVHEIRNFYRTRGPLIPHSLWVTVADALCWPEFAPKLMALQLAENELI